MYQIKLYTLNLHSVICNYSLTKKKKIELKNIFNNMQYPPSLFNIFLIHLYIKIKLSGFPGGAVVGNLPANAGDMGSSPGLGRSHMPRSDWAREPQLLSLRVWSLCSATREAAIEAHAPRWRVAPACHNWRKPSHRNEDPTQPKINK